MTVRLLQQLIQQANADTDRANGQYGDVTAKDGADLEATDNDDLDDDLNVTGAILNGTEANTRDTRYR